MRSRRPRTRSWSWRPRPGWASTRARAPHDGRGARRVLVVANPFPPMASGGNARIVRFCRHLPEHGWEPVVLTARATGPVPVPDGLRVVRAAAPTPAAAYALARRADAAVRAARVLAPACRRDGRAAAPQHVRRPATAPRRATAGRQAAHQPPEAVQRLALRPGHVRRAGSCRRCAPASACWPSSASTPCCPATRAAAPTWWRPGWRAPAGCPGWRTTATRGPPAASGASPARRTSARTARWRSAPCGARRA